MPYDPQKHHRRSIRLKGYDYAQPGAYFVTLRTHDRKCLFGDVVDGDMRLNVYGRAAATYWTRVPRHFPHLRLDAWVVMPNHFHDIIVIVDDAIYPKSSPRTCGTWPSSRLMSEIDEAIILF